MINVPVDSQFGSDIFASTPKLLNSTLPVASMRLSDARVVTLGLSAAMKSPSIFSTPLSSITGSLSVATAMTPEFEYAISDAFRLRPTAVESFLSLQM